jgi:signal transduction histidine kinase
MATRPVKRTDRKPSFFWQGVLILAPMLVLAKVGALAIWQDKRMAEHEAELRAQDLAEQAAGLLSQRWQQFPVGELIKVDREGGLIQPKPTAFEVPMPHAQLSGPQAALLERARHAEFVQGDKQEALKHYVQLLNSDPPAEVAQRARYSLGLLSLAAGDRTNAVSRFRQIVSAETDARGEAGSDLKALALWQLALVSETPFSEVCRRSVQHPTVLTPEILRLVFAHPSDEAKRAAESWWAVWETEELQRLLYAHWRAFFRPSTNGGDSTVLNRLHPPHWLWLNVTSELMFERRPDGRPRAPRRSQDSGNAAGLETAPFMVGNRVDASWLLHCRTNNQGYTVALHRASEVARWAQQALEVLRPPQYLGVSLNVGGHDLIRPEDLPAVVASGGVKGAGRFWKETNRTNAPAVLATASETAPDAPAIMARVHLIGPELLYEQQDARRLWIQMVIVVAALTSVVGFISAYRAFRKQLRLAEMKSNFVSSVSHELRAPIASVRLMAEGLERGKVTEPTKQREYFRFITQECRRLSSMIENVLDFARIEQGRKQYESEPTDMQALVEQTVKLMEPYAAERGVRLRMLPRVPPASCREDVLINPAAARLVGDSGVVPTSARQDAGGTLAADIDATAIQQALVNLIDNAIKHSPSDSEVVVELNAHLTPRSSHLTLSVSDSGPGIPPQEHERIFERFYRLGSELRRETPGVGIGLSIVKHTVEAHGGRVRVESEVGQGSRFTIELPFTAETRRRGEEETVQ